ncbi:MAG: methyl-accepting chemotaxis protein, partial [Firmicutes bacterium]|nr:methyl-accepting chemotaxis protein [Bacillota bacterium]
MKIFNKHSIGNKITSMVIIFVALALLVIGIAVIVLSINTENQQIEERMNLQLNNTISEIEQVLSNHSKATSSLGTTIGITGTQMTAPEYSNLLTQFVGLNDDTYGMGVFYDYNGYKPEIKYFGPYAYRDNASIAFAEALFSTDEYDYP